MTFEFEAVWYACALDKTAGTMGCANKVGFSNMYSADMIPCVSFCINESMTIQGRKN